MSGYQHREGGGTIKINKFKERDAHPDYKGEAMYKGVMIDIALWRKQWPDGTEYYSVSVGEKRQQQPRDDAPRTASTPAQRKPGGGDLDNDIPFGPCKE